MESKLIVRLHMVDEDFAWRLAQELVRIDSSDPGAYEMKLSASLRGSLSSSWHNLIVLRSMPCRLRNSRCCPGAATLWSPCRD